MTVADKPSDETSLRAADDLLKAVRRQMVAFVDDHLPVVANAVVHDTFANEALNDGHIEQTRSVLFRPPPIRPIDFAGRSRNAARRSTH